MARPMGGFPERRSDPTWRARTYVDRRVGMPDPVGERRRLEALERAPVFDRGEAVRTRETVPPPTAAQRDRLYRVAPDAGGTDRVYLRVRQSGVGTRMARVVLATGAAVVGGAAVEDANAEIRLTRLENALRGVGIGS